MKNHKHRDILLALALALGVGLLLYFLSHPAETPPRAVNNPLHASWWDSFDNPKRIKESDGAPFNPDGIRLSRVHDLGAPIPDARDIEWLTEASDGRLFGLTAPATNGSGHLFVYDPEKRRTDDLGSMVEQGDPFFLQLLINLDRQEAYTGIYCRETTCDKHLLVYNFRSEEKRRVPLRFIGENAPVYARSITAEGLIYGSVANHLFSYDPETDEVRDLITIDDERHKIDEIVLGSDDNLYGYVQYRGWFKYRPSGGDVVWLMEWPEWKEYQILGGPDKKLYLFLARENTFYSYDPQTDTITQGSMNFGDSLTNVIGFDDHQTLYLANRRTLRYDTLMGTSGILENMERDRSHMHVNAAGHIYMVQYGNTQTVQIIEPEWSKAYRKKYNEIVPRLPAWARSWLPRLDPPNTSREQIIPAHLLVYEPDTFIAEGTLTSVPIQPHALLVTHTVAAAGVPLLAWGNDGALYGVRSSPPGIVRYDPQRLESTAIISYPLPGICAGCTLQTITADPSGRLIAGVGKYFGGFNDEDAGLLIYDPGDNTLATAAIPISGTYLVKALASAPGGVVYGVADSNKHHYQKEEYAHLFQYNLNSGASVDLGTPFTNTNWTIQALAVAADGKVYGGGGPGLTVDTYYYGWGESPGSRIFVYDPATGAFSYPGADHVSLSRVRTLLAGPDGKVYVGMEIGEDAGFYIYDPATGKWDYWHIGEGRRYASVAALTWGADGLIYGSTVSELLTYDPRQPQMAPKIIGHLDRNGFTYLTAGPDGVIYGAIGSYYSFNPTVSELIAFRTDCATGRIDAWERVTWEADAPRGTGIRVDVLDEDGNTLVKAIRNGGSLSDIDPLLYPALRLRATLTTRNQAVSPVLKSWQVEYTFECQQ